MLKGRKKLLLIPLCLLLLIPCIMLGSRAYSKHAFYQNDALPAEEMEYLYVKPSERNRLKQLSSKNRTNILMELKNDYRQTVAVIDVCNNEFGLYVDLIVHNQEKQEKRVILKYKDHIIEKYTFSASDQVFHNINNQDVASISAVFEQKMIRSGDATQFVDPSSNSFFHEKKLGLEETERIGITPFLIKVFETIDNPQNEAVQCSVYPAGTDIVSIAIDNHISVNTAFAWFDTSAFDENGCLTMEQLVCHEKSFRFRYGREVEFQNTADVSSVPQTVLETWEEGTAVMSLNTNGLIHSGEECYTFNIEEQPYSMSLCNAYFKEQAVQKHMAENG